MAFTPQNMSSAVFLGKAILSPDGTKIVYRVVEPKPGGESTKASIWYASDLFKEDKVESSQITSGQFNDRLLRWSHDSKTIYFLSDRVKNTGGGPAQIYKCPVTGPGEPSILSASFKEKKRGVEEFMLSPDGKYIAFTSAAELSEEDKKKEEEKDDPQVWSDTRSNAHLRIYTISTGETKTLVESGHVFIFSWSSDSKELVYGLASRPTLDASYEPTTLERISILPGSTSMILKPFQISPPSLIVWPSSRPEIYYVGTYNTEEIIDAEAVKRLSISGATSAQSSITNFYTGETDDTDGMVNIGNGEIAVRVVYGIDTRIDIVDHTGKLFELYDTKGVESLDSIDVKEVDGTYYVACIKSSGPRKEAPAVHVGRVKKNEKLELKSISSHYPWVSSHKIGAVERFDWKGTDGTSLDGIAWFPEGLDSSNVKKPLPTIVYIHGGPYYRDTPQLIVNSYEWATILSENGFLVLCPNYRGSCGRGTKFARAAFHGMGTSEWSDIEDMVDEAVKRGLADPSKLGIGGWSQGGFLTAWGASKTKSKFKCAVMGAGVSDWGTMAMESDAIQFEEQLGGAAPWYGPQARLEGDPIRYAKDIETAFLILHGQRDERVPVGQAVGFHRALRRVSKYPTRHELVIYPREPHSITEKKHCEDLLKRVLGHFETWLK